MKKFMRYAVVAVVLEPLITGCSTGHNITDPVAISGKTWVLASINGKAPASTGRITMELSPTSPVQGRVTGQGPCNHYFGGYMVETKEVHFTPMGSTMMACAPPQMQEERNYLAALETVNVIKLKHDQLQLKDDKDVSVLTYVQETGIVKGQVKTRAGGFPAGAKVMVRLQEKEKTGYPPAIVGMQTIQLKEAVPRSGAVSFSVGYAPQLVKAGHAYFVSVKVMSKGRVIYHNPHMTNVSLQSAPIKYKKS